MNGYIVTGASRGLGAALVAQLLAHGGSVVAIARDCAALPAHDRLSRIDADLCEHAQLPALMARALALLGPCDSLTLINNAGTVTPIALVGACPDADISQAVALNLTAPMVLGNAFVALSSACRTRRLLCISSGAAAKPYPGWSVYCATKAGLDHYVRTLAAEQALEAQPLAAVSLYPGVIDTGMQAQIRASDSRQFPQKARFDALKAERQLSSPQAAASAICDYLLSPAFGREAVVDIRTL